MGKVTKEDTKRESELKENTLSVRLTDLENYEKGYNTKVMFLNGLDTLTPLCESK